MSTPTDLASLPIQFVATSSVPLGVTLRSGELLSLGETSDLARVMPTTLVTLVGPPDAGKSTLLATIYECFRQNRFSALTFSGSKTLVAFEKLCHLSRIASGLEAADTQRTKYSEEEYFYHLSVNHASGQDTPRSLLVMDVAGEAFDGLRRSGENCLAITALRRTKILTLLINGEELGIAKERYASTEDAINFLKCVWDNRAINLECDLQIVVTKVDKLQDEAAKAAIAELKETIRRRLGARFPTCVFMEVAARPKSGVNIPAAYGLEVLMESWLASSGVSPTDGTVPIAIPGERESEAYLRRLFTINQP